MTPFKEIDRIEIEDYERVSPQLARPISSPIKRMFIDWLLAKEEISLYEKIIIFKGITSPYPRNDPTRILTAGEDKISLIEANPEKIIDPSSIELKIDYYKKAALALKELLQNPLSLLKTGLFTKPELRQYFGDAAGLSNAFMQLYSGPEAKEAQLEWSEAPNKFAPENQQRLFSPEGYEPVELKEIVFISEKERFVRAKIPNLAEIEAQGEIEKVSTMIAAGMSANESFLASIFKRSGTISIMKDGHIDSFKLTPAQRSIRIEKLEEGLKERLSIISLGNNFLLVLP